MQYQGYIALVAAFTAAATPPSPAVAAQPPTSALDAYEEVSQLRDRHANVIWDHAPATAAELQQILDDLDRGLDMLRTPLYRDLANGNVYLRFRESNFLIDKAIVQARLGLTTDAIHSLELRTQVGWSAPVVTRVPELAALLADPRAATIRARAEISDRLLLGKSLASPYRTRLSASERIAGLSAIWSLAREGFVWFDHVPDLDWDKAYEEAIPKVLTAATTADYYRELMRFTALLRDGHSNAYPPEELGAAFYSRPGLATALIEHTVLVTAIFDQSLADRGLRIGDELLRIDGVPTREYAETRIAPLESSSTAQDRTVRSYTYGLLTGAANVPVRLTLRHADGGSFSLTARRGGYERTGLPPSEAFDLRPDGVAVLVARQFEDDAADVLLGKQLDRLLNAKALVIDIRGNGGGSTNFGWDLLTWLTDKPLPVLASRVRDNDLLMRAQGNHPTIAWRTLESSPYTKLHERIFRGPVALLIDAQTFSAAEDTAAVFKLMRRGPIVGMPSGGSTGQPLVINLPGGGHARICVKRDSYPDGTDFVGLGVQPDVIQDRTVLGVLSGTDPMLEKAVTAVLDEASSAATDRQNN